jgi:hypothetical protein
MTIADFVEKWICCGRVDDEDVLADIRMIRRNVDMMAEECVAYTHDPVVHHVSGVSLVHVVVDNEEDHFIGSFSEWVAPTGPTGPTSEAGEGRDSRAATSIVVVTKTGCVEYLAWNLLVATANKSVSDLSCYEDWRKASAPAGGAAKGRSKDVAKSTDGKDAGAPPDDPPGPSSVFRVCQDVVEVKEHRRVPKRNRGNYVAAVVSQIKNVLGVPQQTAANRLVVRRMANNIMRQHGVRPTHIREHIELVIAGVFVPDAHDQRGAEVLASNRVSKLRSELNNAGPQTWLGRWWGGLWRASDASRVAL